MSDSIFHAQSKTSGYDIFDNAFTYRYDKRSYPG